MPGLVDAVSAQLDLAQLGSQPGLVLFENQSWAPARSVVQGPPVPAGAFDPLRSSAATNLAGATPLGRGSTAPGTALLAEAFDAGWGATSGGSTLRHSRAFGYTNGWTVASRGSVTIAHDGQTKRYLLVLLEGALWVLAIVWWSRGRRRSTQERVRRDREIEREERTRSQTLDDFFVDVSDDDFWTRQ